MYSEGEVLVIQVTLLVLLVILIAALLYSLLRLRRTDYSVFANYMADRSRDDLQMMRPCPLCATLLNPGERVHTVVYSGGPRKRKDSPEEALVHMFGCPHCRPDVAAPPVTPFSPGAARRAPRICPVCKEVIPPEGFVIARMFTRETRKHVHVLGCTECRGGWKSEKTGNTG